ncbi:disease resistance protein RPV1-like [Pyrus x bretschneideri]|uniref:disease resistance protein RPV1-like n=1 Tax=Pyrus x bretschneideri TaxID=225117 RepID=UPI00202FEC77|nr:disease resistance protein RPV1-like [Pyrus x bretschneideri]XP_048425121.1 disease resistance protein RPV1-like [Pyrus x bretschneideri]XP_048425122.1 disease resistance protein RPV1-like [Pyrus x bretschneideri]XP_048425123.1 disease resistance protein RPV1-like [Pyrus x bretschneideri]XP_048425124.1 disease resistance protein RPV1-like [Pyrus x bretschneideri]XP_048425125.1 disease resistance protein RPV1-like [Pyrus x bretschneideri]XP_048425126.1 disease resistance protein RPV1-like [
MASSSSSPAAAAAADADDTKTYDVFISFRGEDTRRTFTSHLHAALLEKKITTYVDDKLKRGDEIAPALLEAIKESELSVIIFSKDYASSTWCLDELVHIIECKEKNGQLVIPIFYDILPSDVRKQQGSYAFAFDLIEQRFENSIDKVRKWRDALTKAANISGFDSKNFRTDADLVKKVVEDISTKLCHKSSCGLEDLVGIESRIEQIESLLDIHSQDACITVGIWGMGGIGKTTIADAVFRRLSSEFEASCFLRNVREISEQINGLDLLEKFLLQKILQVKSQSIGSSSVSKRLSRTKVLIVLDDVSSSLQMERLASNRLPYGTGSRIIITSRDRSILRQTVEDDKIYEVEGLETDDALQLFCSRAFKNNSSPGTDHNRLAKKVVHYAGHVPLALIVLGSLFFDCKSKEDWEDELNKLKRFPSENIQKVLRISYEGLGRNEKEIFLDIACFHKGRDVDEVKPMLDIRGFFAAAGIRILTNMSLISLLSKRGLGTIEMHDLLQEMGRTIVQEQCIEDPSKRNRLFNDEDVYHVLKSNMGTPNVQAILVNWSKIKELRLKRADFKKMSNLTLLIVVNSEQFGNYCKLNASLDLPDSLRYLYWCGYPLKSLPSNFSHENLVELHMPESQVKELWKEDQRLVNLQVIDLAWSTNLTEVPNLSRCPKIVHINLRGCYRLVEIPWYFQLLDKLTHLDLGECTSLKYLSEMPGNIEYLDLCTSGIKELPKSVWSNQKISYLNINGCKDLEKLPSNRCKLNISDLFLIHSCTSLNEIFELPRNISELLLDCKRLVSIPTHICKLKYLKLLDLYGCPKLEDFPKILEPMEHLESLCLSGTAVQELHSSIEFLPALKKIELQGCKWLSSIPENICKLKYLERLDLKGCSSFSKFPEILKPMEHLESLSLQGTAVDMLPSSIENLIGLQTLDLMDCKYLKDVPTSIYSLTNLRSLNFYACRELEKLPSSSVGFLSLKELILSYSGIFEIPDGLFCSTSLQDLNLCGTRIRSIPASIKQASQLSSLCLYGCKQLQYLPELPGVRLLRAQDCTSLKTVSSSRTALTQGLDKYDYFCKIFINCPELDKNARSNIMDDAQLRIMQVATAPSKYPRPRINVVCPGKEIPNWFGDQSEGSSVNIKLCPDWFRKGFSGFALSAVVSGVSKPQNDLSVSANFIVKFMGERHELFTSSFFIPRSSQKDYCYGQHHVYVWNRAFRSEDVAKICSPDVYKLANEASVEFCPVVLRREPASYSHMKVESCGIRLLYAQDPEKFKFDHV